MSYRLFNRSLFVSTLVVGGLALFSAAGCYKADLKAEPAITARVSDAAASDPIFGGCGPDAEYKGGTAACGSCCDRRKFFYRFHLFLIFFHNFLFKF